jgi:hypothetical protein
VIVEARGFVLRRNWLPVLACGVLVVGGVLGAQLGRPGILLGPIAWFVAWFGLMFAPIFVVRNAFPRAIPVAFRATEAGLVLDGAEEVKSEDILEAKVTPRRGPDAIVELALRGPGPKRLTLRTGAREAKALVELFGARRTRFRLMMPFGKRFLAAFVPFVALVMLLDARHLASGNWLLAIPGCAFYAVIVGWLLGFLRGRLVIGADGFTTKRFFREQFTPFRDVTAVKGRSRFLGGGVEDTIVELRWGAKLRLRTVEAPNTEEERGTESRAMLTHMYEAFTRSARLADGSVDVPALVRRGARSATEWLSGIDALVRGGGSRYRVAAVSNEMLSDLACDPGAAAESRVGAAAALIRMGDESLRTRVRVAAEACAASELRDTLLALSEARDDQAAERALALLPPPTMMPVHKAQR